MPGFSVQVADTARRVLAAKQLVRQILERQGRTSSGAISISSSVVAALLATLKHSQLGAAGSTAPKVEDCTRAASPTFTVDPVPAAVSMLCKGQVERGTAMVAAAAAAPAVLSCATSGTDSEAGLGSGAQRRERDSAVEAAAAQRRERDSATEAAATQRHIYQREGQHPVASALAQLGLTAWDVFNKEPLEHVSDARACEFWQHLWDRSVAMGKVSMQAGVP